LLKKLNLQAKQDVVRTDMVEGLREKYAVHKRQSARRPYLGVTRFDGNGSILYLDSNHY
jgi:hypothetical protein